MNGRDKLKHMLKSLLVALLEILIGAGIHIVIGARWRLSTSSWGHDKQPDVGYAVEDFVKGIKILR